MATKKALVVGSSGLIEELQSGDTLDVPGGGSSDIYIEFHLFGRHTDISETSGGTLELIGANVLNNSKTPSSPTATFYVYGRMTSATGEGFHRLNAINGGTTTLGTISLGTSSTTEQWRSADVSSDISSLGSGVFELELVQQLTAGSGSIECTKAVLIITD